MYDQVTLGLNVDPFILSALKEDITSEDVSTNSVMPHPQAGEVDLICKTLLSQHSATGNLKSILHVDF